VGPSKNLDPVEHFRTRGFGNKRHIAEHSACLLGWVVAVEEWIGRSEAEEDDAE
jgi:hypothetical protein